MKKRIVVVREVVVYHIPVEIADDADDEAASEAAEEEFVQASEANAFFHHVADREAIDFLDPADNREVEHE